MTPEDISIHEVSQALLDDTQTFPPRYLYRLSGLEGEEAEAIKATWPQISLQRRRALLEDVETLQETNYVVSFDKLCEIALQDEDPGVRTLAIQTLWESEDPALIPQFLDILENDTETETRAQAASALGRFVYLGELEELAEDKFHEVEEHLLRIMNSEAHPLIRRRALEAMGFSGRESVADHITEAYEYGDEDWLASALFAMGRSGASRWKPEVLDNLSHESNRVKLEAAKAAGELYIEEAVPELLGLLEDLDAEVRVVVAWALSEIGGDDVREALEALQEETTDEAELEALENALDNLAFTEDMPTLDLFDFDQDDLDEMMNFDIEEE